MSRPPIHRPVPSPRDPEHYFGPDFTALVALAESVARDAHGIEIPAKGRGLARTLIELPALLAHILGEHQSLYAREASPGTARLAEHLTRHARKLAYAPDPGVAAVGLAAFTVKPGLSGSLPAGFALMTSALGEEKARVIETIEDTRIDAAWNAMRPADAALVNPVRTDRGYLQLPLKKRHGLARDEVVLLVNMNRAGLFRVTDPMTDAPAPMIGLAWLGGDFFNRTGTQQDWDAGYRLHVRPKKTSRLFGWNAAALWPAAALANPASYAAPATTATVGTRTYGYESPASPGSALMLDEAIPPLPNGAYVAVIGPAAATPYWVEMSGETVVSFVRGEVTEQPQVSTNTAGVVSVTAIRVVTETRLSARVSTLALNTIPLAASARTWTTFPLDAQILSGWTEALELFPTVPNPGPLQPDMTIAADLSAMRPGRPAILRRISTGEARAATLAALKAPTSPLAPWQVRLEVAGGFPSGWALGDVEILGNVTRVSDGETKTEILGSSDGVTPHQSFALKNAPVTRLAGAEGAQIALDVRVDGVAWQGVQDFHGQGADARIYVTQTDADGHVTIRFGGEGRGAIPPSGRRNLTASYRQGLGGLGNAGKGRLSRIRKSSPLIEAVTNPLPILGGTDPAGATDIARQAVRPVRVFDRAVSVEDHADLALLYPGITRAQARWRDGTGIELVAADAEGNGPADLAGFMGFMDARRDSSLPLQVVAPQPVDITLALRIERDPAWLSEAARRSAEEALLGAAGLFTFAGRELSAPQSLSGVYALLLSRPGIAAAMATRYRLAGDPSSAPQRVDMIHASTRQWLRLLPAALEIQMLDPGGLDRAALGGAP